MIETCEQLKTTSGRHSFAALDDVEIFARVERMMERERRFLDPCLTMESLAAELNVHRNALSRAVNVHAEMSFSAWLGSYRIAEVERLAALPENHGCSTAMLALQSGFSNRTSFYRVFKKTRNATPSTLRTTKMTNQK